MLWRITGVKLILVRIFMLVMSWTPDCFVGWKKILIGRRLMIIGLKESA
jgi:hypothetical protein